MRKITTLFLASVILFSSIPAVSPTATVARAATNTPADVPEGVCEKLEKLLDGEKDLIKALQEVAAYLQKSAARIGAGSGAGRTFSDLFKNASSKLDTFLKNYGVDVTDFTTSVTWGPMSMARKLALLRSLNPSLTPLLLETIEAFIKDYIEQGYAEGDAEELAEGVLNAVDHALGALPLGTRLGVEAILRGLIELMNQCRKQREGIRDGKPRDTVGNRGTGDKSGKLGVPNSNHDPRTNVTVYCIVYGPIGVHDDGTPIMGYYWVPC